MSRWIRTGVLGMSAALLLVTAAVGVGLLLEQRRLARTLDVPAPPVAIPTDASAIARGRYLFESRGCAGCHGESGSGRRFADTGEVTLAGPDITRGGTTRAYGPADWVRSVRHGVAPGGRPLRVMPSEDYNRLTDADLGALVAYIGTLPAGDGTPAVLKLPLPARVLYGYGQVGDAADRIDHTQPPEPPVAEAVTAQHGRYVAQGCIGCHGSDLAGGRIPGAPPDWPAAPRLTAGPGSVMLRYTELQAFRSMMKTGRRADGSTIAVMPVETLSRLNEVDLQALHLYLLAPQAATAGAP